MFAEAGFIGNVWIAQFPVPKAGMSIEMHEHDHDHVSLLVSGSVEVNIIDQESKIFNAPTFIVIRANMKHEIKSLSDDVLWYCIFALRDLDGNVINQFDESNAPPIDPIFNGTQSSYVYKDLYNIEKIENKKLKLKNIELEDEVKRLKYLHLVKNGGFVFHNKPDQ